MLKVDPSSPGEQALLSPEQQSLVRQHLERILLSHAFAGSKRTQDFMRLVVTHTLDGDTESLKERMIGAELFGRPIGYDTGSDSVVRVRATEARKKLALYYGEPHTEPITVRIELPSGSYVPRFHFEPPAPPPILPPEPAEPSAQQHPSVPVSTIAPLQSPRGTSAKKVFWPLALSVSLLLIAALAFFLWKWRSDAAESRQIHSIAILPLENLSSQSAQEYYADGLTEELINHLGQVSTLRVLSLTSSMSYKGTKKKLPEIANELHVDAIVEGGVLREGDRVRISAQLVDARTDRPIWAHTYDRNLTDVLSWQGEVAQAITEEITTKLTPQEQARLVRQTSVDAGAHDQYLQGILLRENGDCAQAIQLFNRAIAISANYAQAHSGLATCYGMLGESGRMPYEQAFTLQKAEALKAIQLDDSISEAHAELANTAMTLDRDWAKASSEFHRAIELNPNSATNHEKYAFFLVRSGHPQEAISEIERSVDLDPVSGSTFHSEGFIYYFARQYDRAYQITQTVRNLRINVPDWAFLLGAILAEQHNYPQSIAALHNAGNGPYALGHLGNAYARSGNVKEAEAAIAQLQKRVQQSGIGRYEIALIYAGLNRKDQAFDWLQQAFAAHDVGLVYLKVDPCLDSLRSDPRYQDLLRRAGLTP